MAAIGDREPIRPGDPRLPSWVPKTDFRGNPFVVFFDGDVIREAQYGQYVLPNYAAGKPGNHDGNGRTHQRVTTFIGMAEYAGDGLTDYYVRNAIASLVENPVLFQKAFLLGGKAGLPDKHRETQEVQKVKKAAFKALAEELHAAIGANEASEKGSEVHAATEWVDLGNSIESLPTNYLMPDGRVVDLSVWTKHVEAYVELRDGNGSGPGFFVSPELVERTINPSQWGTVGTFDRLVLFQAPKWLTDALGLPEETEPRFTVLDVKSGDVDYRDKFGRQMYTYACADAMWNFSTNEYEPMPDDVNKDYCLVVSIPWWEENPVAELIPVPLVKSAGLKGLEACDVVKRSRSYGEKAPVMKTLSAAVAPKPTSIAEVLEVERAMAEPVVAKIPKPRAKRTLKLAGPKTEVIPEPEVDLESQWVAVIARSSAEELKASCIAAKSILGAVTPAIAAAAKARQAELSQAS